MNTVVLTKYRRHDVVVRNQPANRSAVTLMECIFAIGVILTGLVGLTALIPVAARNAQNAMELDRSITESTSAAASGVAHRLHDLQELVMLDKPAAGSSNYVNGFSADHNYGYNPTGALQTVQLKMTSTLSFGKLETPGYGHHDNATGLTSALCIDPFGVPSPALVAGGLFANSNASDSAFDYSRFPYYSERYRVLSPPNASISSDGNPQVPTGATPVWPMSPRMYRVTLRSPLVNARVPMPNASLLPYSAYRVIFQGSGGLTKLEGGQDDAPRSILMNRTSLGGNTVDASRDSSGDYSWFATLVPSVFGGTDFRQSIVVVRSRLSPVPQRLGDPLALQKASHNVDDTDDNPTAERLTWIDPETVIGFNGGAGGEISVYGSQQVDDTIVQGEWVMLSRQRHELSPFTPTGPAVHRWYRVIRVDESEQVNNFAWAGGTHDVWRRRVALSGSDWAFDDDYAFDGVNDTAVDDTFMTIVPGAVSVIESDVVIEQP